MGSAIRSGIAAVAFGVVSATSVAAVFEVTGPYTTDRVINAVEDSTVRLNGTSFHDCQLKLTGDVTFTLELVDGTVNEFLIDGKLNDVNCSPIKATKSSNIIIDGTGKLKLESTKKMSDDNGIIVCNNLTVRGGSTSVTFDNNKSDTSCIYLKGSYLQTGGKVSVDLNKKNCTNEFYGVNLSNKNTSFTMEGGEFNAEIAGTKSRAIDLRKSCTATFRGGDCTASFEGPQGRFVSGGTIVIEGGNFSFTTNITSKMTAEYYPTDLSAIKADYSITVSGGDFEADLPLAGSEIFTNDSETGTDVTISDGTFDLIAGDDCIHAKGDINISGGRIRAYSTGDDAIDANGGITISGGDIRAYAVSTDTHGFDVNNGKVSGVKKTLTISGGTVIATDGPDTIKIGTHGSDEVGNVDFIQPTYYGTISSSSDYSQKYLLLEGETNGVPFTVKPCLPALPAGNFNLLVSVPGRAVSQPAAKSVQEAYGDASSHCPLVFEKKAKASGNTLTTKEGAVLTLPDYYDLDPSSGKHKTFRLALNDSARTEISAIDASDGVEVTCATRAGLNYQLKRASSLDSGTWNDASPVVAGDGSNKTLKETSKASGSAQFYKVEIFD